MGVDRRANYVSYCWVCEQSITPGREIAASPGGWIHVDCATRPYDTARVRAMRSLLEGLVADRNYYSDRAHEWITRAGGPFANLHRFTAQQLLKALDRAGIVLPRELREI